MSKQEETLRIQCPFGTLVAGVFMNDGEYNEFFIDLERPDGRATQVAVIGTYSGELERGIHTYVWDGDDEEPTWRHETNPDGKYCY